MRRLSAARFQSCAENRNFPTCKFATSLLKTRTADRLKLLSDELSIFLLRRLLPAPPKRRPWVTPRCLNVSRKHKQMLCSFNVALTYWAKSPLKSAQASEMPLPPGARSGFITRKVKGHRKCLTAENRLSFKGFPVFSTAFT